MNRRLPLTRFRRFAGIVCAWWLCAACSSEDIASSPASGGQTNSGSGGQTAASGGTSGGSTASCDPGPGYQTDESPQDVRRVTAKLLDASGAPLAQELVQVCGLDICVSGKTGNDGSIAIQTQQAIKRPALKFGEGLNSARFAWLIPKSEPEFDAGEVRGVRLPSLGESVPLSAGETATQGGLSLKLAAGTSIAIDVLTFQKPAEKGLRAVRVPLDEAPEAVPRDRGFELLYAATPTETHFCPPAELSVENSENWEPGTEVEVFLHGVDVRQEFAPYGEFAKVSDARVSEDGKSIVTTEPGLPVLGVLAFKRK
ncbi:MAG TPA: hypothetical protein VFQ61_11030 [Polyangiaceae bacterium]|nr:hypothetical protein [Polyangiaceae bacterium]